MKANRQVLKEIEHKPLRIFSQTSNHPVRKVGSHKTGKMVIEEEFLLGIEKENRKYREALNKASLDTFTTSL